MIEQVIAVPRNGYANRLQAWASSAVLANQLGASLSVCWSSEDIAHTPAQDLFSPELLREQFISPTELEEVTGSPHETLPRYLSVDEERGVIVLAGHDRGEQDFMAAVKDLSKRRTSLRALIIIAGGKFQLPGTAHFDQRRRDFYRSITWSEQVNRGVHLALDNAVALGEMKSDAIVFSALHLRETDRSIDSPTSAHIRHGLHILLERSLPRSLFVCADTSRARNEWQSLAAGLGFDAWSSPDVDFDRTSVSNGVSALIDWRLLSMARGVVFPDASTFSSEAVVAGGSANMSVALRPPLIRRVGRSLTLSFRRFGCRT